MYLAFISKILNSGFCRTYLILPYMFKIQIENARNSTTLESGFSIEEKSVIEVCMC